MVQPPTSTVLAPPVRRDRVGAGVPAHARLAARVAAHPLAAGLAFSLALALVASRGFLFRPGWIAYSADFSIHTDRRLELENWLTGWNHFVGDDNSPILSVAPVWLLLLSFMGTAMAQKLFLFAILFTASASAYFLAERWARDAGRSTPRSVLIGALCGLCYTVNPWVATEIVHFYYVWMYALLPLTVFLMARAVDADSVARAAGSVVLVGVLAVATLTAYGLAFHVIVAAAFLVVDVAVSRGARRRRLARSALLLLLLLVTVAAVGSYSVLPVLLGFGTTFAGGTSWALFTTEAMYVLSPFTPFVFAVRGMFRLTTPHLVELALPRPLFAAAGVVSALPAVLVGIRLFLRRLDRKELALVGVLAGSLLVANGTNWPVGSHYATVAQGPLSLVAFVLFKGPYKLLTLVMAALVLLSIRTLITLSAASGLRALAVTAGAGMAAWSLLLGSPVLSGDLVGYLRPVQPPAGYLEALRSITSDEEAGGRAVWLPVDVTGQQHPEWAPRRPMIPLHGGTVSPPAAWLSPGPVSSRGTSYSPPAAGRVFDQLFTYAVMERPDVDLARLLRQTGRAHVVLQRDVAPEQHSVRSDVLEARLRSHPELVLVAETPHLAVFTAGQPQAAGRLAQVGVGGHEQLLLAAAAGRDRGPADVVLADDVPADRSTLERLLRGAAALVFSPGQSWEDLALDTWPGTEDVHGLADLVTTTAPLSPWKKSFFESNEWAGTTGHTGQFAGQRFGPGLSGPFLFTTGSASVGFESDAAVAGAEVWVRAYVNPGAGTLRVAAGGRPAGRVDLDHDPALGWKWFRLGRGIDVAAGEHVSLEVSAAEAGRRTLTALDQVALLPAGVVPARIAELQAQAARVPVGVGGGWESYTGASGGRSRSAAGDERLVTVPRHGTYRIGVSRLGDPAVFGGAAVGGVPLVPATTDAAWRYSGPVDLAAETYVLRLPGLDPGAFVTVEEVTEKDGPAASAGAAPPQRRAGDLRLHPEPFSTGWRTAGADASEPFRVNGFVTGFLASRPLDVRFGPDVWVHRARIISLFAATAAVAVGLALSRGRAVLGRGGGRETRRARRVRSQ